MQALSSATLQDIAERAGFHRSTVALALRNSPRISRETREKIKAIADGFGYRVNPLVAALMKARRMGSETRHLTLAFVTNHPTRFGWRQSDSGRSDSFSEAVMRAEDLGYNLEHFWFGEPGMTPSRFTDILVTRNIHGLIIGELPPGQDSVSLPWERFCTVALGLTLKSPQLHRVTGNHFETASIGMQQCRSRGYRRVGFVFSDADSSSAIMDRWLGAYFLQQTKYPLSDRVSICPGMPTDETSFSTWFRNEKPDALLVTQAAPVLGWLRSMHYDVPRDVGLVELKDSPQLNSSGVHYNAAKVGAAAVDMLVSLLHQNETGVPLNQREIALAGEWREGNTLPWRRVIEEECFAVTGSSPGCCDSKLF